MNEDRAFAALAASVAEILPDIDPTLVTPRASLRDLGANSIDRAEIILEAAARLGARAALNKFAGAADLGELARLLAQS